MDAAIGSGSSKRIARRKSLRCALASAAALGVLAAVNVANAEVQKIVIRDVTLAPQTTAQAERLYNRIRRAARTVCSDGDERALREWRAANECTADAIARAVASIDNTMLTAVHQRATRGGDAEDRVAALDRSEARARD